MQHISRRPTKIQKTHEKLLHDNGKPHSRGFRGQSARTRSNTSGSQGNRNSIGELIDPSDQRPSAILVETYPFRARPYDEIPPKGRIFGQKMNPCEVRNSLQGEPTRNFQAKPRKKRNSIMIKGAWRREHEESHSKKGGFGVEEGRR